MEHYTSSLASHCGTENVKPAGKKIQISVKREISLSKQEVCWLLSVPLAGNSKWGTVYMHSFLNFSVEA